jgi:DNA-binding MarR family transcriptional regulator
LLQQINLGMSSAIQQQIRQQRPFRTLEEEVFVGLQLVSDVLMQPWAAQLKQAADLTPVQYNLLRILRGAGEDGLTASEVGERLITRSPDVTRLIDRLEKRKLVTRRPRPDDRRAVRICITATGRDLLAPLDQKSRSMIQRQFGGLSARKLNTLRDLLDELLSGVVAG